ncbi:urea carboxylase-associated family protein [Paracoccus benzoatiresistens]|uniref:Urea carboxylase-associated family protein n=1 Tax=Paracoccus benzoatiresistens TaxID=2997341 RepID=A0ABT4JBA7_9RHOB|nr:urea carboxylase-associated family protein [Paracoccus sp. EF6]MCZ0964345.1 urea carboxylase-associated family protein [Paracoccus sp. EF6]
MTEEDVDKVLSLIPARRGVAARIKKGQIVTVINTHGSQVIDTWAFSARDVAEFMSMEHSRGAMLRLNPQSGDTLRSNRRRPMLTLVEDTSGGVHDTLIAACDRYRYEQLGHVGYHDNCTDNLAQALSELGLTATETPSPLNLFMNIPVHPDQTLSFEPPVSKPGSYISLRAEMDLVIAFSACPQDLVPVNGAACVPTEAHFRIEDARPG